MNAVSINNVNVRGKAKWLITEPYLGEIKQIADTFAAYGIRTFLSINFGAPITVGGLETADPLAEEVITFGKEQQIQSIELFQNLVAS